MRLGAASAGDTFDAPPSSSTPKTLAADRVTGDPVFIVGPA
jgi:hypothetical protein